MKKFSIKYLFLPPLLFYVFSIHAQNSGKIISKVDNPKKGIDNSFIYYPPVQSAIPEKIFASIVYETITGNHQKLIATKKLKTGYEFLVKGLDTVSILIIAITDSANNIVDNNSDMGYPIFLQNKNGTISGSAYISAAKLLNFSAQKYLKLDINKISNQIISFYEKGYKISQNLSKDPTYKDYLNFVYKHKKDVTKPKFLVWAKELANTQKDEWKWDNAIQMYYLIGIEKEWKRLEAKAISIYPNGILAKSKFFENFYSTQNLTEESILDSLEKFKSRFGKLSVEDENNFYTVMLGTLLDKMIWEQLPKYEALLPNKAISASMYNNFAWKLSGEELNNEGTDLDKAKMLSSKAVYITYKQLKKIKENGEFNAELQGTYNNYADTYALILYKTGQYDSAFYYQDAVYKQGGQLDPGGLERYAVYSEKIKGKDYARKVIEDELLRGVNSHTMLKQLNLIYKELNLSVNEFDNVKQQARTKAQLLNKEKIKKKYGSLLAPDFYLKNSEGNLIALSSLKNKTVILDFWATWCVPCKASFPYMQEVVNKYKGDSTVVFLFIDTYERKTEIKTIEDAMKFVVDNKYTFRVLFDIESKVAKSYKLEAIPAKFVIDRNGEMLYMDVETKDLIPIIEEENKLFFSK